MSTTIRAIVAVALIALATAAQAQTAGIRGVVVDDANEEPLIGASIYIEQLRQGDAAGSNGEFAFSGLAADTYTAIVSYMGYRTRTEKITLREGEIRQIKIRLEA